VAETFDTQGFAFSVFLSVSFSVFSVPFYPSTESCGKLSGSLVGGLMLSVCFPFSVPFSVNPAYLPTAVCGKLSAGMLSSIPSLILHTRKKRNEITGTSLWACGRAGMLSTHPSLIPHNQVFLG